MDPESIKELLASIRKMMGKQRSCSTTDMGCRNMECCFIEENEVDIAKYTICYSYMAIRQAVQSRKDRNLTVLVQSCIAL